ncbi:signal peptidase I [Candidatus Woesebacteria bacterium]|jgi:signal peptidase I|nr:signal peptidase I [Candidatus Woesebacteria bacterium]HNV45378.1 signal peptidase I [Candidatus Woesebacteria bacterium]HOA11906.1 signal peptidase I [Candidatus Woesebacteria bacterium]HOC07516.1 signal peptidase I [Candidatus Woesebacteria bacterium]HOI05299.1 signal peptidase I [Candidatus Woesebacteria bacterium]
MATKFLSKIAGGFLDLVETVAISLSIFLVIYLFLMQPHQVNGQSMLPNFQDGEHVMTDKISYKFREPMRGEVVVFHAPPAAGCVEGTGCDFIKRIIAVPGDKVAVHDNAIWINGQKLPEPYIPDDFEILPGRATLNEEIYLGPDEYFVSGDNRPHSSDSRFWGPITKDEIVGRVFLRYWPISEIELIKKAEYPAGF